MTRASIDLAGLRVAPEDFLAAVLETAAQPIWVVDADGLIRFANPAAVAALGYDSADELFGRHSHETIHYKRPDGTPYPAEECPMLMPRVTGETVASELDWFFRRDGSMFPVSYVSVPLEVGEGRGAVVAFTDIEDRLRVERELRERDDALAAQQASLRRVATLVAGGAASAEVFAAIAREVAWVLQLQLVEVSRYEPDGTSTVIGAWSDRPQPFETGTHWPLDGPTVSTRVKETGRPVRVDYAGLPGAIAAAARAHGITSGAGAPIIVDGQLWGSMATCWWGPEPMPYQIEDRLAEFTALIAAAFSNTASRDELARLVDEQAALRRVATLVARGVPSPELFAAVAREVGQLLGADLAGMIRYVGADTVTAVAVWAADGRHPEVPGLWSLEGDRLATSILSKARPAREDDWSDVAGPIAAFVREQLGIRSSVGSPVVVEGRVWGALFVHARATRALPRDTESRLVNFTELVATAISNAQARADLGRLAGEQAALRRVATLVARESPPQDVFAAVTEEVGRQLSVSVMTMFRYEEDGTAIVVADWGDPDALIPIGTRMPLDGENIAARVCRTGRPARIDDYTTASGTVGDHARSLGVHSGVGTPIVVEGRVWGAMVAVSREPDPLPADTESRIGEFTELVATAIANVQARTDLAASRARIVSAADAERRRVVRDLHDGAQQRLVHTVVTLKLAHQALQDDEESGTALVTEALDNAQQATAELRELAHGILPTVLTRGGLRAAVQTLAERMPVPVECDISVDRHPSAIEATAYFVIAESLTNVAKHSRAERATVLARVEDATLHVQVRDDGIGGARPDGSGFVGLADRLATLDGRLQVESPAGGGTLVAAAIPLPGS